jgi:transposase-like protein
VDKRGRTVSSYLSRTRDQTAAKTFLRQALKLHGEPRSITLDDFEPSQPALRRMGMRSEFNYRWSNPVKIGCCKYLNNIVEQDHRRVKFRVSAMLGFKSFQNASVVRAGVELIQKLKKGQYGVPYSFGITSLDIWKNVLAA